MMKQGTFSVFKAMKSGGGGVNDLHASSTGLRPVKRKAGLRNLLRNPALFFSTASLRPKISGTPKPWGCAHPGHADQ